MPVEFFADLHIHTCLSPCAELSMTPRGIIGKAAARGLNIIAICDHNSAENVAVTQELGHEMGISVIPGMEICSAEEVHLLGLFGRLEDALAMQEIVYAHLQSGENDEEAFGMQVVVNEADEVLSFNKRLLIGATALSVNDIVDLIHRFGGLAFAGHIDRVGFGIIGQLGFIPEGLALDALELSGGIDPDVAKQRFDAYRRYPWISSSDAHRLDDIGSRTTRLLMRRSTFGELCLALRGQGGRKVTS
jgi:PHP family Zn ribbon phosphoesterase